MFVTGSLTTPSVSHNDATQCIPQRVRNHNVDPRSGGVSCPCGVAAACNNARVKMGDCYRDGLRGCEVNAEKAAFYYHMAGEGGDARGLALTGLMLVYGFGAVRTYQQCPSRHGLDFYPRFLS